MKKILLSPWIALVTVTLMVTLRITDPSLVESIRLRYFDFLISSKPIEKTNIYTVNIDEAALEKYGQWPFPRNIYAEIIEDLYFRNAGLVVFNVMMPDKDRFDQDFYLSKVLEKNPVILPITPSDKNINQAKPSGSVVIGSEWSNMILTYPGIIANLDLLENVVAGSGIVNTLPEIDGVNRRMPLVVNVNGTLYASLSLEILKVAANDTTFQVKLSSAGVEKLRIPNFGPITTDNLGRIWVDFSKQSVNVSLTDMPRDFAKSIVIVGITAAGIGNPVPTSIGSIWPHEMQASVLSTMIDGTVIQRPVYADLVEVTAILVLGLLILSLSKFVYIGLTVSVIFIVAALIGSYYTFFQYLYLLDGTFLSLSLLIIMLHVYSVKFISEFLQKMQIKKQFGTYLSPAMVEKLQKDPDLLKLGGESKELSIMFTDVRGFTSISEHYGKNVQGLTEIMNRYMTAMTASIINNNGTLDKYIGDAQMAFWNAPLDESNHASLAVKTSLEMMDKLNDFNREIQTEGVPPFGMGIGINSDTVVVGNMGSDQRFDYTCLGDGVNLASRLEGQSKPYGVKIILGPKTAEMVKDEFFTLRLDCIAVKGKTEGVNIFTVLDLENTVDNNTSKAIHNLMLEFYRNRQWDKAREYTQNLVGSFNGQMDKYYLMWLERIAELEFSNLDEAWDGIYRAQSK